MTRPNAIRGAVCVLAAVLVVLVWAPVDTDTGIVVGATPGLGGVIAMAISVPILISVFGFTPDALFR